MRGNTKILLAITVGAAVAALGAGAAWVLRARTRAPLSVERASEIGRDHAGRGEWVDAYKYLAYAAEKRPADATLQWEAAQPALRLRQKPVAYAHASAAWDAGMKTPDVLLALLAHGAFSTPEERLVAGRRWLESIPEGPARRDLEADVLFLCGKKEEAVELWLGLPMTPALAGKIAAGWIGLGQSARAVELLRGLRGGMLDDGGYAMLGGLLAALDEEPEAAVVFEEGRARHPRSASLRYEWCVFLAVQDRHAEAVEALDSLKARGTDTAADRLAHAARLLLGLLAGGRADAGALDALAALAEGDEPWLEGERALYRAIRDGSSGRAVSIDTLLRARALLRGSPAAEWAAGRELARWGDAERAVTAYRAVEGPLARSPALQLELARVLARASRHDEALATLARLHGRKRWSRGSMELYRDLAAAKGLRREAADAQAFLEAKFAGDADLLFTGGALALRFGELAGAAKVFDTLLARQPDRRDAEVARLSILLARREYDVLLRECDASRAPKEQIEPLRAEALVGLGRPAEAEAAFERAVAAGRAPSLLLGYANLLLARGKADRAGELYAEVLRSDPRNEIALLGTAALALQRGDWVATREAVEKAVSFGSPSALAYAMLSEAELGGGRPDRALAASTRGLALAPDDADARFRQGVALLELGHHGEAEAVLRGCTEEKGPPHVLWQLARVRIARGDEEEALRFVESAPTPAAGALAPLRLVLLARAGRAADARALLETVRGRITPTQALACDAWIHECEGRLDAAAEILRRGIAEAAVAVRWADVMFRAGRDEGVIAALDAHALDGRRWLGLAERARERKLPAAASACYRRAMKSDPENPLVLNNFAWTSLQARSVDLADILAAARKAVALAPDHPAILHTYGTALLKAGRDTDCVALLERETALAARSPALLLLLGEAYEKVGKKDAAVKRYAACLEHPGTEGIQDGDLSRASLRRRIEALSP